MLQRASNSVHGGQHTSKTITSTKCSPVYVWGRVSRLHEYRPTQGYCGVRTLDFGQFEYRRIKKNKIRKPLPLAYRRCACTRGSLSYRDLQVLAEPSGSGRTPYSGQWNRCKEKISVITVVTAMQTICIHM